jgi:hypothetical protein
MKIMKMKGGWVPYNFQHCRKFCQNILLLSEYAKNPKYMSSFNRDKGPTDKVHNKRENYDLGVIQPNKAVNLEPYTTS